MRLPSIPRPEAAALAAALALGACGGGDGVPSAPAAPTAAPTVAPTPEPPLSASCERLPLGSPDPRCRDEGTSFQGHVLDAIATLQAERPEYFQGEIVTNVGGYYAGLVRLLDRKGLCAGYDGEELSVKATNEFSEHYKVLASWGQIRRQYMGTCYPAAFPLARKAPAPSTAGCPLPPSVEVACGRPDPRFLSDVEAALDQVLRWRPELFDLSDRYVRRGPGSFRGSCYPAAF